MPSGEDGRREEAPWELGGDGVRSASQSSVEALGMGFLPLYELMSVPARPAALEEVRDDVVALPIVEIQDILLGPREQIQLGSPAGGC